MARYRLAESQIQAGNLAAGRMELEDLLKRISAPAEAAGPLQAELATEEGKKLPAEIRWLMVQSYFTQPADTVTARTRQQVSRVARRQLANDRRPGHRQHRRPAHHRHRALRPARGRAGRGASRPAASFWPRFPKAAAPCAPRG